MAKFTKVSRKRQVLRKTKRLSRKRRTKTKRISRKRRTKTKRRSRKRGGAKKAKGKGKGADDMDTVAGVQREWVEQHDAHSPTPYYWNRRTRETRLDPPEGLGPDDWDVVFRAPSTHFEDTFGPGKDVGDPEVFDRTPTADLYRLRTNRGLRGAVDAYLKRPVPDGILIRPIDVSNGKHVELLQGLCRMENLRIVLSPGVYNFGDSNDPMHINNHPRPDQPDLLAAAFPLSPAILEAQHVWEIWEPDWKQGFGPLQFAQGVTLVGQEGVELLGSASKMEVHCADVSFESLNFTAGLELKHDEEDGGAWYRPSPAPCSMTMTNCSVTNVPLKTGYRTDLVMRECRVFDVEMREEGFEHISAGLVCDGNMTATQCTFEDNALHGILVTGSVGMWMRRTVIELVDCTIRRNGDIGLLVSDRADLTLRGGTISGNIGDGVAITGRAWPRASFPALDLPPDEQDGESPIVTVSVPTDARQRVQTVSSDNGRFDWATEGHWQGGPLSGEIRGIPDEEKNVENH